MVQAPPIPAQSEHQAGRAHDDIVNGQRDGILYATGAAWHANFYCVDLLVADQDAIVRVAVAANDIQDEFMIGRAVHRRLDGVTHIRAGIARGDRYAQHGWILRGCRRLHRAGMPVA